MIDPRAADDECLDRIYVATNDDLNHLRRGRRLEALGLVASGSAAAMFWLWILTIYPTVFIVLAPLAALSICAPAGTGLLNLVVPQLDREQCFRLLLTERDLARTAVDDERYLLLDDRRNVTRRDGQLLSAYADSTSSLLRQLARLRDIQNVRADLRKALEDPARQERVVTAIESLLTHAPRSSSPDRQTRVDDLLRAVRPELFHSPVRLGV